MIAPDLCREVQPLGLVFQITILIVFYAAQKNVSLRPITGLKIKAPKISHTLLSVLQLTRWDRFLSVVPSPSKHRSLLEMAASLKIPFCKPEFCRTAKRGRDMRTTRLDGEGQNFQRASLRQHKTVRVASVIFPLGR